MLTTRWYCSFGVLILLLGVSFRGAHAACECELPADTVGVVWQGTHALTLPEVAGLVAPIMSFSTDEPLLRRGIPIPSAHPCDAPAAGAVVYYQVPSLIHDGGADLVLPLETERAFSDHVRSMELRFFFYYPEDVGMHGHRHDVEGVEMEVAFERGAGECRLVRLRRVIAFAHGAPEYQNRLEITPDTRLPIVLMVEEGKHADCPDRNADGQYTPGYDVNERTRDAWGVRDIFGAGHLMGAGYAAKMTKMRHAEDRMLPPSAVTLSCRNLVDTSIRAKDPAPLGHYELRSSAALTICAGLGTPAESTFLAVGMMKSNGFGTDGRTIQSDNELQSHFSRWDVARWLFSDLELMSDEGRARISRTWGAHDVGEGWLLFRTRGGRKYTAAEVAFTPSATVWAGPYLAAGWEHRNGVLHEGHQRDSFASEAGIKFRLALPEGSIRWLFLNQRFGGLRLGIRSNGFEHIDHTRYTVSIGSGAF